MARRSPANDKGTLPGIPAPAVFDEPPARTPVIVDAGGASNEPSVSDPTHDVTEHTEREGERTDTNGYDPYRFGATKFPPGLRSELIQTKLPRVDPEELKDTVPPNAGIEAFIARPTKRAQLLITAGLVVLAIGGPVAWVAFSDGDDKTKAPDRANAAIPAVTPSTKTGIATIPPSAAPFEERAKAALIEAAAPISEPVEPLREKALTPKVPLTGAPPSPPRPLRRAAVRTIPLAPKATAVPPPASVAPSGTASNVNLFDLPIGPKLR